MDSAIYDFSGHLQPPVVMTSLINTQNTYKPIQPWLYSLLLYSLGLHLSLLSALSGERPCLEPFCIPFQLQTELSAHSLINEQPQQSRDFPRQSRDNQDVDKVSYTERRVCTRVETRPCRASKKTGSGTKQVSFQGSAVHRRCHTIHAITAQL